MSLIRFQPRALAVANPASPAETVDREIDRLFERAFGRDAWTTRVLTPPMDIEERGDHYQLRMDLPGLTKDDLQITLHDGLLSISGEKKVETEATEGKVHHRERWSGKFSRSLRLAKEINVDSIEAVMENGVLGLKLPFVPEAQPRKIEVQVR